MQVDPVALAQAHAVLLANLPPRYHRLDRLERYVEGTQYDERDSFWCDDKPIMERAPCIVYPVVESAIRSTVDLCLGEGRWPSITASHVEEDAEEPEDKPKADGEKPKPELPKPKPKAKAKPFDERFALDEAEAESLDALIDAIVEQARLKSVCDDLMAQSMGAKTSVAIAGVRDGKLFIDTTRAKWCTVERDESGEVKSLEIRYPYLEEYKDRGKWSVRCMLYRRVIDDAADTTYLPAKASEDGAEPDHWVPDPAKTKEHGLGFCPVHWYARRKSCGTVADEDGHAVHERLLDEVDGLNFALSLRHRAALYASDPQTVEIGVDEDHNPAPAGRQANVVIGGGMDPVTGKVTPGYIVPTTGKKAARMRGVGVNWRYPSKDSQVDMLTLPGDALKAADENARDLRSKIAEALGVVFIDPDNAKFSAELSGKALARLYDRQVRLCDKEREDFGDNCLLPLISLLLRIALSKGSGKDDALYLSGVKEALPILERFVAEVKGKGSRWFAPQLDLTWGPYFEPDAADGKALVELVTAAHTGGFITKYTAVEELRDIFEIGNVDRYLDELEQEGEAKAAKQTEQQVVAAEQMAKIPPPPPNPLIPKPKPAA